jgi:hypothetical protein
VCARSRPVFGVIAPRYLEMAGRVVCQFPELTGTWGRMLARFGGLGEHEHQL